MALADFRAIYLPYCLKKQNDGSYIVLNREYKPLGFNTYENVEFEKFPISTKLSGLTRKKVMDLSWNNSPYTDSIFLYNDATNPIRSKSNMTKYLKKIEVLAKLKEKAQ